MVGKTPRARALPQLEELEPREIPSASGATTESFDGTALGGLPANWSQWSTSGSKVFAVSAAQAESAPHDLAAGAGRSSLGGRAWLGTAQPADVRVSASVFASTLIPAQVFARGNGLGTAAPSYYAVSLTRGLKLELLRIVNGVLRRESLASPPPYLVLDSLPNGGSPTDARTQLATLAEYYLLADPNNTFLDFYGGFAPSTSWAVTYDVGQPAGGWSLAASGADPSNSALTYHLYQRAYTNALVLYKPLSYNRVANGTLTDASATSYTPGGSYRVLQADGSLGPVVTSISLRNGEGAILIKVGAVLASTAVAPAAASPAATGRPPRASRGHEPHRQSTARPQAWGVATTREARIE